MSLITRIEGAIQATDLLLMGHTDVVPVTPSAVQRDPFAAGWSTASCGAAVPSTCGT